jgi:excisionase family DNA binding protein
MSLGLFLRVDEVAKMTGYKPSTIRKKLLRREIGFHKVGRIIVIPQSEVERLLGEFRKPITTIAGCSESLPQER